MPPDAFPRGLSALQARYFARIRGAEDGDGDRGTALVGRMVAARFEAALRHEFPCVAAVLGADVFARTVASYVALHPSRSPSIRNVGARFAAFLEAQSLRRSRPDLVELAHFEWARIEVADAPDDSPLCRESLARWPAARGAELRLRLVRAFRLVPAEFAIEDCWLAVDQGTEPPHCVESPGGLFVWRRDSVVYHRRATAPEVAACRRLGTGAELAEWCAELASGQSVEDCAMAAFRTLEQWLADGLVADAEAIASEDPSSS